MAHVRRGELSQKWRTVLRVLGFLIGAHQLVVGSLLLLLMMIAGAMSGYVSTPQLFLFLVLVGYVYGTAGLAFWFGLSPGRRTGIVLAILLVPTVALYSVTTFKDLGRRRAAHTYAVSSDQEAVERAQAELLEIGRRSGDPSHVRVLLKHLKVAKTDEERARLVEILGRLSYQYEPLLEELRRLREETRNQPGRVELHRAVERAILEVNPHEDGPWAG